jgi:hypothetical protein
VKYDLTSKGETNAFVIEDGADYILAKDGADYKPVDGVFTPDYVILRHDEEAQGDNFSVSLLHKPALSVDVNLPAEDMANYNDEEADYNGADYYHKEPTDFYTLSSCKKDISEPPTPTLRPIV